MRYPGFQRRGRVGPAYSPRSQPCDDGICPCRVLLSRGLIQWIAARKYIMQAQSAQYVSFVDVGESVGRSRWKGRAVYKYKGKVDQKPACHVLRLSSLTQVTVVY